MPEGDALASHGSQLVGSRQARGRERHACICVQSIASSPCQIWLSSEIML